MPTKGPQARTPSRFQDSSRRFASVRHAAWSAAVIVCARVPASGANVTSTWIGPGNWNDPTKWSNSPAAATFPNNGNLSNTYDAVLGSSTTLNVPVTLRSLTLNGGTIGTTATFPAAGTNTITVTNGFRWSGGYFQAPITVQSGATFTLDTSTGKAMGFGGTFTLAGTTAFSGSSAATIQANRFDTRFDIAATGVLSLDRALTFTLPAPDPFSNPATRPYGTINNGGVIALGTGAALNGLSSPVMLFNTGTIRVTGASEVGTSYVDSSGLIDLQSASAALTFRTAPAPDSTVLSGRIRLVAGSALNVVRGGVVLAGPSVTNAGTINLQYDTNVAAPTTLPGVVNFGSNSARMTLNADLTLTGRSAFYGGPVSGAARVTAYDFKPWGTTFVGSELYIPAGGSLDMGDTSSAGLDGGRLTLDGKAVWGRFGGGIHALGAIAARVDLRAGALVDIRPSAVATFAERSSSGGGGGGPAADLLTNAGTIRVDNAALAVGRNWAFNNSGTVKLMPGSSATLSSALATNSGTIDLLSGTSLLVNGDVYDPAADALGVSFRNDPTGVLRVGQSATATFSSPYGGKLLNAGLVEVNGGRVSFDRYFVANAGRLTVNSGTAQLGGYSLVNSGTIGTAGAATLEISAGAVTNLGRIELGVGGATMTVTAPNGQFGATVFRNETGAALKVGAAAVATFWAGDLTVFANAGAVDVDHGRLTFSDDWGFSNSGGVVVTSGVLRASLRSFTNTGGIDLRDGGGAVFGFAPTTVAANLQRVRDMVVSGFHAGAWDGAGIRSASAATDPTTAVGYALAAGPRTFLGVAAAANDVLVRHTKYGDANLDGVVNFDDLLALAKSYSATTAHWYQGDFSYDGTVNFDDLLALARNYGAAMPAAGSVPGASAGFSADLAAAFAQAAVPEPSGVAFFGLTGALVLLRRRRRRGF